MPEYPSGGGGGGATVASSLLKAVAYNPGSIVTYTTVSAADADVDAANLVATFTVPASGAVLVRLTAECDITTNAKNLLWTLRAGAATVAGPAVATNLSGTFGAVCVSRSFFLVTGLTPGATLTYKWGFCLDAGGATGHIYVGGVQGAGLMEVWAA